MKYKLNPGYITQKIENKTTIFSGKDSTLKTLNETAAYIFQGLKLGWDKEKIIKGLIEFGATPAEAENDLKDFTQLLIKKGIIDEAK